MIVSAPAWLWQLVLPLLLLLLFLLQHRARDRTVSSLLLWKGFHAAAGRRRFTPPPLDPALAVGLAVLVGLALAAAAPWWTSGAVSPAFAVVVDRTSSMATADGEDGERRIAAAAREALSLLRAADGSRTRILVLAGESGTVVRGGPGEIAPFERALASGSLADGEPALETLVASAAQVVHAAGGGTVVVLSDFAGTESFTPELPGDVRTEMVSFGRPASNVAVTELVVSPFRSAEGAYRATAVISGNEPLPRNLRIEARVTDRVAVERTFASPGDGPLVWSFELEARPGDQLTVHVSSSDALPDDDALRITLPRATRFELAPDAALTPEMAAAVDVLGAAGRSASSPIDVTVYDGDPPESATRRWIALAEATRVESGSGVPAALDILSPEGAFLEPFHPLLVEPGIRPAEPPPGAVPLAALGGRTAIALVERGESRGVWCGIPLERTDPARRGALPLVLAAMLDRVHDRRPGGRVARASSPELTPHPPAGARGREESPGRRPEPLRGPLLAAVAALLGLEAARRLRSAGNPARVAAGGGAA